MPGIAEEVPGAADRLARLEDRVALAGAALLQVVGGADAGEAGADDQHVDMFERHSSAPWLSASADSSTSKAIPARCSLARRASPIAVAGRHLARALGGSSSKARQSADSASIFEVSP